ncbi:hypothetical protein Bca4012_057946 [Brassica carinata]|uniref:Uncharacterized protein n=1 Tax=Brassica carinata TaxID=52824 RepID=A0A8X7TTR7_BRACI|nr:hypothetical protein Bca52824_084491 [Brassica carinata]
MEIAAGTAADAPPGFNPPTSSRIKVFGVNIHMSELWRASIEKVEISSKLGHQTRDRTFDKARKLQGERKPATTTKEEAARSQSQTPAINGAGLATVSQRSESDDHHEKSATPKPKDHTD